jgi:hypothetical protein
MLNDYLGNAYQESKKEYTRKINLPAVYHFIGCLLLGTAYCLYKGIKLAAALIVLVIE